MSATVIRFPDMVCQATPRGQAVKATTAAGRALLSDALGLPARRPTEVEPTVLDILLSRRRDLVAYDMPRIAASAPAPVSAPVATLRRAAAV